MIGARITINLDDLKRRLSTAAGRIQLFPMLSVSEWLRLVVRKTFTMTHASPEGVPWAPLSEKYAARKKGPGILRETSALFDQVGSARAAPVIEGNTISLGSNLPYAAAHQYGFEGDVAVHEHVRRVKSKDKYGMRLNPKLGKMTRVRILLGEGKVSKYMRHAKNPARPYLPTPEFVEQEATKIAEDSTLQVLRNEGIE
jgi:phage gpG-like protein